MVVVKPDRRDGAGVHIGCFGGEHRGVGFVGGVNDGVDGAGDGVVGDAVKHIGLRRGGLRGLGDFGSAGGDAFDDFHSALFGGGFGPFHERDGVGFAGVVDDSDGLGAGEDFGDEVQVLADGRAVGDAGDIAAGVLHAGDEFGADGVGDGGEDDGDGFGRGGEGLGGWGCDADEDVGVFADELLGDLRGDGGVALGGLELEGQVVAFGESGVAQSGEESLAAGVQGGVFDDLGDGDGFGANRRGERNGGDGEGDDFLRAVFIAGIPLGLEESGKTGGKGILSQGKKSAMTVIFFAPRFCAIMLRSEK